MNPILKRVLTGITVGAAVILAIVFAPVSWFRPVVSLLAALAVIEYGMLLKRKLGISPGFVFWLVVGAAIIAAGMSFLPLIAITHSNLMLLYVLAIVKFSDTGGFAFGVTTARLMKGGNHKLCPSISPGKSWEGLLGSVVFAVVVSAIFMSITHFSPVKTIAFGVAAAVFGTAGDLVESKFKRWIGVKDSSSMSITAGMGGFLDMFDSLLFAPAILFFFI